MWFPNQTSNGPWLCLEILSMEIMKRNWKKGQPYQHELGTNLTLGCRSKEDFYSDPTLTS